MLRELAFHAAIYVGFFAALWAIAAWLYRHDGPLGTLLAMYAVAELYEATRYVRRALK